ncbi:YphA family membrane protein [Rossellomorea aquimaris]|uniref:YphA family membrane protein n=1 Tax=Rossellomorea aquimaris TaxID=189382 RepID=UPI0007D0B15D|nr:hypothetical protein [Rossellomorea aquimaris]
MDGIYYLWFLWGCWTYSTFIMSKKDTFRFYISFLSLVLIIVFPYGVTIYSMRIAVPVLVIIIGCFIYIRSLRVRDKLYLFITLLTIGLTNSGLGLISIYDPILMFLDTGIVVAFSSVILSFLFYPSHSMKYRVSAVVLGCIAGDFLLCFSLNKIGFLYSVGNGNFLDSLTISLFTLIVIKVLNDINHVVNMKLQTKGEMNNI